MDHADHVNLIRRGVTGRGGIWADLGAGSGAFTLALAELLGADATIYAVDRDGTALDQLARQMQQRFPATILYTRRADFTTALNLPLLDGIVMANSLHFFRDKLPVLKNVRGLLRPHAPLIVVEYDVDRGNQWVPWPFRYDAWQRMAREAGFTHCEKIGTHTSRFMDGFYAAASWFEAGN